MNCTFSLPPKKKSNDIITGEVAGHERGKIQKKTEAHNIPNKFIWLQPWILILV